MLPDPAQPAAQARRDDLCAHVFSASATLVGVCLTVIGLLRAVRRLQPVSAVAQQALSVDAVAFLAACVTAYGALRTGDATRRRRAERYADGIFLLALAVMAAVCLLVAGEMI